MNSRHALALVFIAPFAFASQGCTDDKEPVATASATPDEADLQEKVAATITFAADPASEPTVEGKLSPGARVEVKYDAARLTKCRNSSGGKQLWTINGYALTDGSKDKTSFSVAGNNARARTLFTVGQGYDLALWFDNVDTSGCQAFDSKYGANYHFALGEAPKAEGATITFPADPKAAPTVTGRLVKGGALTVKYDSERLTKCRNSQARNPLWTITGNAQINQAKAVSFYVAGSAANPADEGKDAVVALSEAGSLALWFENTSTGGCQAFDSNLGQNYRLTIDER